MSQLIKIIMSLLFYVVSFKAFAVDTTAYDFSDPKYFNNPMLTHPGGGLTGDFVLDFQQESIFSDVNAGFDVDVVVKKCVPRTLGKIQSCQGAENLQGARSLNLISTHANSRFNKIKAHFYNPTPPNTRHLIAVDLTLHDSSQSNLANLQCSSSLGTSSIVGNTLEIDFLFLPVQVDLEISCNKKLKKLSYLSFGEDYVVPGGHLGNPILMDKIEVTRVAIPQQLLAVNSCSGVHLSAHSSVNIDALSLSESIPLTGVPFSLNYSSDRFASGFSFSPKAIGLGGWSPSIRHHYDIENNIIYYGAGGLRNIEAIKTPNGYYATDESGALIYYFDMNGLHTQTKEALTGALKYSFTYDASGRLVSIVDGFNNTTSFGYLGGQVVMTSPYGQISVMSLDSAGYLASVTNPNNETYQLTTNASGHLRAFQKPAGQTSYVTYDASGRVLKDQGAGGDFINLLRQYDASSGIQSVTVSTALNRNTLYKTSATSISSQHSVTDPNGSVLTYSNQDQGQNTSLDPYQDSYQSTLGPDPRFAWLAPFSQTSLYHVANSNINISKQINKMATLSDPNEPLSLISLVTTTTLQNDRVSTTNYNAQDKLFTFTSPSGRTVSETLNASAEPQAIQISHLAPVNFAYDSHGRLSSLTQKDRSQSFTYDIHGNLASSTDTLGRITRYNYDKANRLTQQILPDGNQLTLSFDANGNMTSLTPPGKTPHSFSYNIFELVGSYLPPALNAQISGAITYSYNLDKQLTQINQPDGTQLNLIYDSASAQLISMSSGTANYAIQYLPQSDLVSTLTSPDQEVLSYQYAGNTPVSIHASGPVTSQVQYSYNTDGSVASIAVSGKTSSTTSASSVSSVYDKDGLVTGVGDLSYVLNDTGAISSSYLGKISEAISYNNFGEPTSDAFISGKNLLSKQSYLRDHLGRIISVSESRRRERNQRSYHYDKLGRLEKVFSNHGIIHLYKYDANSNRIEALTERGLVKAEYDAQDRLVKYGNTKYEYSASGDLSRKIETRREQEHEWSWMRLDKDNQKITSYSYDNFGNLKSVVLPNHKKIEYIVDGQNRRIGKKINAKLVQAFVYQNQTQIIAELDGDGNLVKRFIYGSKMNIPDYMIYKNQNYRIISDQVGTPKLIVKASTGKVVEEFDFDEFGVSPEREGRSLLPFGFAGGLYDQDTKLVRFGARDYDPETGRWLSKDPILFAGGDTNLFGYVANDPVNFVDPRGLWAFQVGGSIGGLLGPILGVGGSAESGIAISYSGQYGFQFAGYQSAGVRAGTGLYGGASLNFSLTPSAQRVGDLNGGGITGGFDTPIFGGSVTKSGGTCGNPSMNTYTLGVGPGVIGDIYGGATGTRVGAPLTLFGGQ